MARPRRPWLAVGSLLAAALCTRAADAQQSFEVMAQFVSPDLSPAGRLLAAPDGSLYGTMPGGGAFARGALFALRPDGVGGFTVEELYSFSGQDGAQPVEGVSFGSDGRLYGATSRGGANDVGTFFRLDRTRHLTQLDALVIGDATPPSRLTPASDGNFYGTTPFGGAHNFGILFRLDPSGPVTPLHGFGGPDEGAIPNAGLVQAGDGRLWGTTLRGGAPDNPGTIFAIDMAGNLTTVHRFSGTDGLHPAAGLATGSDSALYGTTPEGGTSGYGTVFRITAAGTLTTLHDFTGAADGASPAQNLVLAPNGSLYGTTSYVPRPIGPGIEPKFFRIDPSGNFTTIPVTGMGVPGGPLTLGADGGIYVPNGFGIFRIDVAGAVTTVYSTPFSTSLRKPRGPMIELSDGSLYGVSDAGLIHSAIFRLDPSGQVSTFHEFSNARLNGGLLHLADGRFYGTKSFAYANFDGGVFRVDASGVEESLHEFSGPDGSLPAAGLTAGPSGELWGTTQRGGDADAGTVFRIDSTGTFTSFYSFDGITGLFPSSPLLLATDENFYSISTTSFFRVDPQNGVALVHDFSADNSTPVCIVQASDDNFYGATRANDFPFGGLIFRIDTLGSVTPLDASPAALPATLIEAADGNFYGTVPGGDFLFPPDYGSVFRMDSAANVTTVHAFDGSFGGLAFPSGALLEASDGNFYGPAGGGLDGEGGLFRLVSPAEPPSLTALEPSFGRAAGGAAVTVRGNHFRGPGVAALFGGVPALGELLVDQATLTTLAPALAPGTIHDVTVTNSDGTMVTLPAAWFSDFLDVPGDDAFHEFIERVFRNGITAGCGAGNYCPSSPVTRAQMAVFLLKAEHGSSYTPPPCTGHFDDVACPGAFAVDWIEQLAAEGITAGCGDGTNYCPGSPVLRQQMAVFLLKAKHGSGYTPPPCAQVFADVACPSPFADWIEQLAVKNVTGGCGGGNFCPSAPNTRGQMAVFLSKTFSLP